MWPSAQGNKLYAIALPVGKAVVDSYSPMGYTVFTPPETKEYAGKEKIAGISHRFSTTCQYCVFFCHMFLIVCLLPYGILLDRTVCIRVDTPVYSQLLSSQAMQNIRKHPQEFNTALRRPGPTRLGVFILYAACLLYQPTL